MSLHLGLHVKTMAGRLIKDSKEKKALNRGALICALIISAYGIYVFIKRGFSAYMFLQVKFAFIDTSEPIILFMADFLAVMVFCATVGYIISRLKRKTTVSRGQE